MTQVSLEWESTDEKCDRCRERLERRYDTGIGDCKYRCVGCGYSFYMEGAGFLVYLLRKELGKIKI